MVRDDDGMVPSSLRLFEFALDERPVRTVSRHALAGREVPSLVPDRASEVGDLSADTHVRSDLVGLAFKE